MMQQVVGLGAHFCYSSEADAGTFKAIPRACRYSLFERHLVSLGALITVLALAYEPFFQQILTYPERMIPVGQSVTWAATTFEQDPFIKVRKTADEVYKDPSMTLAIDAVFNTPSVEIRPSKVRCPTGTCTWPSYSTLGVCHQCQDMSQALQYICRNHTKLDSPMTGAPAVDPCGFRLNNTFIVGTSGNPGFRKVTSLSTAIVNTLSAPNFGSALTSTHFASASLPIADFYIGYTPGGPAAALRDEKPVLAECLVTCK